MPSPVDVMHALLAAVWSTSAVLSEGSALTVVVLLVAALIVVAASALLGVRAPHDASVHPRRGIGVSSPLAQSDPDAAGHARPRAPGFAAVVF
jgi:hypothetical protein